jgi:serine/threonine protein kinase
MGYYKRFFREEKRLGMGAEGSVYLATHIISGNILGRSSLLWLLTTGTYAVKKIAVGTSKEYLVKMLREVRLLETLRHPNIIPYYHSWMDETHFSSFGPPTMALHVLMMYASAGNLDDFLLSRSHTTSTQAPVSAGDLAATEAIDLLPKAERIKAFKQRRKTGMGSPKVENRGVLLLSVEEILHLFTDIVEGLAFLVGCNSWFVLITSILARFFTLTSSAQTFFFTGRTVRSCESVRRSTCSWLQTESHAV